MIAGISDTLLIFLSVQTIAFIGFLIRQYILSKEHSDWIKERAQDHIALAKLVSWSEDRTQAISMYHERNEEAARRWAIADERHTNTMQAIARVDQRASDIERKLENIASRIESKIDAMGRKGNA